MSALGQTDMCGAQAQFRFAPESDIKYYIVKCPLWAKSGHGLLEVKLLPPDTKSKRVTSKSIISAAEAQ